LYIVLYCTSTAHHNEEVTMWSVKLLYLAGLVLPYFVQKFILATLYCSSIAVQYLQFVKRLKYRFLLAGIILKFSVFGRVCNNTV